MSARPSPGFTGFMMNASAVTISSSGRPSQTFSECFSGLGFNLWRSYDKICGFVFFVSFSKSV